MTIDEKLLKRLFEQAVVNPRLRVNYDLRNSSEDGSQRMLNALLPGTQVPIHRHPNSSESVVVLCGVMDEVLYDDGGAETERIRLCPAEGCFGCQVPKGVWHSVDVLEPTVILEVKDGRYGEDGSEQFDLTKKQEPAIETPKTEEKFENCLGDLKKNIEYLIGMERHSGSMEVITPLYVSRMLNEPLDEVEVAMNEMGL